jgi:hypothetical protein
VDSSNANDATALRLSIIIFPVPRVAEAATLGWRTQPLWGSQQKPEQIPTVFTQSLPLRVLGCFRFRPGIHRAAAGEIVKTKIFVAQQFREQDYLTGMHRNGKRDHSRLSVITQEDARTVDHFLTDSTGCTIGFRKNKKWRLKRKYREKDLNFINDIDLRNMRVNRLDELDRVFLFNEEGVAGLSNIRL